MTPTRARTASQRAADVARALISFATLLALLIGLPSLLWLLTSVLLPDGVAPDQIASLLTSHDLNSPFFAVIMAVGWIGWATFALCTLLEIPAQLRGRPTPRLPALGFQQRLAGMLVSGILVLLPAGTAMAAPSSAPPIPTTATAPATVQAETPANQTTNNPQQGTSTYTVQPRDSLSKIALRELGDASRWRDIASANKGRNMPDGSTFNPRSVLKPGWKLHMPDSWHPTANRDHVVKPGESLSSIAKKELGNPNAYPKIVQLNEGKPQSDGRDLTNPNLIYPGWALDLPAAPPPHAAPGPNHPRSSGTDHTNQKATSKAPTHTPSTDQQTTGKPAAPHKNDANEGRNTAQAEPPPHASATPKPTATPHGTESDPSTVPATPTPPHQQPAAHTAPTEAPKDSEAGAPSPRYTAIAASSLFAAAILAVLGGRRALQQRRRRPRRRIPMPQTTTATADLEKHLRIEADIAGLDLVDRALRTLATNCARTSQPLPPLEAVRVTARGLELHLATPTPPIAPFKELQPHPQRWWCSARGAILLDDDAARDVTAPYPALISIGETQEQEPVLLNLESVRLLRLTGTSSDVRAVMLGMAVELASSTLSDDATIVLAGLGEELAEVFPPRIQHHPDLADAIPGLQASDALQRNALITGDFDDLNQARLTPDGGDTWIPTLVLLPDSEESESAEALSDLLTLHPRTATTVITDASGELDFPGAWTLPADPGEPVQLPGLQLSVTLQRLDQDAYEPLLHLLSTAANTGDIPAPAWTRAPHSDPTRPDPRPPSTADSALSQEVAAAHGPAVPTRREEELTQQQQPPGDAAIPAVRLSVATDAASMATSLPSLSALAPTVTGTNAEETAHTEEANEPFSAHETAPEPSDPFDVTLREVLDERKEPAEAPQEDIESVRPGNLDDLAAGRPRSRDLSVDASPALGHPEPNSSRPEPNPPTTKDATVNPGVLAALNTPPDPPAAPQIRLLGPVDVVGTLGKVESNRRNGLTEIAAWLSLHPGKSRHELNEAIWPGQRVLADTRNTNVSKLRTWLGRDPLLSADDPHGAYLPPVSNGVYALSDQVTSDWSQFQYFYQRAMHTTGTDANIALARALSLVRGRPFSDIDPSKYTWAEYDIQEMISTVVDVAHELSVRSLGMRDYRVAAAAASRGLVCDQHSELLYRDLFTIYSEAGDRQGLERTAHHLSRIAMETGCDAAPETVALVNALMDAGRIVSA